MENLNLSINELKTLKIIVLDEITRTKVDSEKFEISVSILTKVRDRIGKIEEEVKNIQSLT